MDSPTLPFPHFRASNPLPLALIIWAGVGESRIGNLFPLHFWRWWGVEKKIEIFPLRRCQEIDPQDTRGGKEKRDAAFFMTTYVR